MTLTWDFWKHISSFGFPHNISQHTLLTISLWFHYTCLLFLCQEFLREVATPEFLKNYRMMVKAKKAKLEVFYFTWRPQKKIEILIFLKRYIFSYKPLIDWQTMHHLQEWQPRQLHLTGGPGPWHESSCSVGFMNRSFSLKGCIVRVALWMHSVSHGKIRQLQVMQNYDNLHKWFSKFGRATPTINEMKISVLELHESLQILAGTLVKDLKARWVHFIVQ